MPSRKSSAAAAVQHANQYKEDPAVGPMLRFQRSLPHLPVPTLESTAAKYLDTVRPHLTPTEFSATKAAVDEFLASPFVAELQKRLLHRANNEGRESWLSDWWNEAAYMGFRGPIIPDVNYFYVHRDDEKMKSQTLRAASQLKGMLRFRELINTQQLQPDHVKKTPLCMDSYQYMFNAARYPVKPVDQARKYDQMTHNHIVVLRKNKFYEVDLVDSNGRELTTGEIEAQLQKVIHLAGPERDPSIGVLTGAHRDLWADARDALLAASPQNNHTLTRIESAILLVCLDDTSPATRDESSWQIWAGERGGRAENRWFDKHELIVFANGKSGYNGEHSLMDGTPSLRMNDFVLGAISKGKLDHGPAPTPESLAKLPQPKKLEWVIDAKSQKHIDQAGKDYVQTMGKHDLSVLRYDAYGKNYVKTHKVSPDAWFQMVKQLAYYKMYGKPAVVYESCQTRKFKLGRTEVIRSVSNESTQWVKAMLDSKVSNAERATLFRAACKRHLLYAGWAADAQGVDRHLFGLKKLIQEGEPVPSIYTDPAYGKTNNWVLSTSSLASDHYEGWGYGEVVPEGFGLSYMVLDDSCTWTITSAIGRATELNRHLAESATEVKEMMEAAAAEAKDRSKL